MSKIAALTAELQAYLKAARDIAAAAEAEDRDFTDDERASVVEVMDNAKGVKARLEQAKADADMLRAVTELGEGIGLAEPQDRTPPFGHGLGSGLVLPEGKSLGELFVESPEYADLLATAPGGVFTKDHRVQGRPVGVKSLLGSKPSKTLITGADDTSAGSLVQPDYRGLLVGLDAFQRPLNLRNVVTSGTRVRTRWSTSGSLPRPTAPRPSRRRLRPVARRGRSRSRGSPRSRSSPRSGRSRTGSRRPNAPCPMRPRSDP